jgi:hypothetical protein
VFPYEDDAERPVPAFHGASPAPADRSLGGPMLSALSRLPIELRRHLEAFVVLVVDHPESITPLEDLMEAGRDRRLYDASRAAVDLAEALFGEPEAQ